MWTRKKSVGLSIAVCIFVAVLLLAALFIGPSLFINYISSYRGISSSFSLRHLRRLFCACFYPCAAFGVIALYTLIRLLLNIYRDKLFIKDNVLLLRILSWCCFAVSIITFIGTFFYFPFVFIAVSAGFVGLMLRIVKNIMQSAVELREENDLTI